jgi:hypothetical protein
VASKSTTHRNRSSAIERMFAIVGIACLGNSRAPRPYPLGGFDLGALFRKVLSRPYEHQGQLNLALSNSTLKSSGSPSPSVSVATKWINSWIRMVWALTTLPS